MADAIIYVAGNADAYPVEFYDADTGRYEGMIPELLREFSDASGYDVRYYQPEKGDQRASLAEHRQVDIVTAVGGETFSHADGGEITVLTAEENGEAVAYRLLLTDVAPESLLKDLQSFLDGVSAETRTGLLVQAGLLDRPKDHSGLLIGFGVALLLIAVLAAALGFMVRRYRRQVKEMEKDKEADDVTGIGNIDYLNRYFGQYLNDNNKILYHLLYFYVDTERLDRSGGRNHTNEMLRHMAMVLQDHTGDTDILARIADGGFVLLRICLDDREEQEWLLPVLDRLENAPWEKEGDKFPWFAIGCYRVQQDDHDLNEIVFDTAQCAQAAYREGESFRVCTDAVLRSLTEERQLQKEIKHGLANGEFQLFLQFYVDARDGRILGGEALSRWDHPVKGLLTPGDFVPLMEKEHLVAQLDYCALGNACRFLEEMHRIGRDDFFISCNFSTETFSDADFAQRCEEVFRPYDFPKSNLIFELTDSPAKGSAKQIAENLERLRNDGIGIALDDFGALFSSFHEILTYPLDMIKLDKHLVDSLGTKGGDSVVRGMISVAADLGLKVLAEGVETEAQAEFLRSSGCDALQGYRFFRPVPEYEARKRLLRKNADRSDP